jgi:sigma-B regulation protein RsbU (phosphoserine phosphatase)
MDWPEKLLLVDLLMRAVSRETDPHQLVRVYREGVGELVDVDEAVSISRRGADPPWYRITRSWRFTEDINPWEQQSRLPLLSGGFFGDCLYDPVPRFIPELDIDETDPAHYHLQGLRSCFVMPQWDAGEALNMTFLLWRDPAKVPVADLPAMHWQGNLFGRTTANLALRKELSRAYSALDRELQVVGDMQRSLLPQELPAVPGLDLAAEYRTSQRAGGDLYDVYPLPDGSWGLFIGDVSGHGTPAAVVMAITHALAHAHPGPPIPPDRLLAYLNDKLCAHYTSRTPSFVTAFYAVYDPRTRTLAAANAGHPPPRLIRGGRATPVESPRGLPLGVDAGEEYAAGLTQLHPGDTLLLYTDGLSEAFNPAHQLYGFARLDQTLSGPCPTARDAIDRVLAGVGAWQAGRPPADDQTMLAVRLDEPGA